MIAVEAVVVVAVVGDLTMNNAAHDTKLIIRYLYIFQSLPN